MELVKHKQVAFSQLRESYILVKNFLETESGGAITSLDDKIGEVLGIDGDDVEELLVKFVDQSQLNWGDFNFDKHFYSEGELFSSGPALRNIIVMLILVVLCVIQTLSFKTIKFPKKPDFSRPMDKEVTDLTFRQMLTWYLEREFVEEEKVIYQLT